jgi:hypothetical protein
MSVRPLIGFMAGRPVALENPPPMSTVFGSNPCSFASRRASFASGQGQTKDFWGRGVTVPTWKEIPVTAKTERPSGKQKNVPVAFFRPVLVAEEGSEPSGHRPELLKMSLHFFRVRVEPFWPTRTPPNQKVVTRTPVDLAKTMSSARLPRVRARRGGRGDPEVEHGLNLGRTTVKVGPQYGPYSRPGTAGVRVTLDGVVRLERAGKACDHSLYTSNLGGSEGSRV